MLANWFRGLTGRASALPRHGRRKTPAAPPYRPEVERLEDRTVPSAIRDLTGFRANIMLPTTAIALPFPEPNPALNLRKTFDPNVFQGGFTDDGSTGIGLRTPNPTGPLVGPTQVPLGFNINFFGHVASGITINTNGNVTLGLDPLTDTPGTLNIESSGHPMIAPFFADVDTLRFGSEPVTFGQDVITMPGCPTFRVFGIDWINVSYYHGGAHPAADKVNSFQLILIDRSDTGPGNFDIEFNYNNITWETGDADNNPPGANGLGPRSALAGVSDGTGLLGHYFLFPGSGAPGSFLNGGPNALNSHMLSATTPGRYHLFFRNGQLLTSLPNPPVGAEITKAVRTFFPFRFVHKGDSLFSGRFLFRRGAGNFAAFINQDCLDEIGPTAVNSTGPAITLVFPKLPKGVTLVGATGVTASGAPFITLPLASLPREGSQLRVILTFRDPLHKALATYFEGFPVRIFAGPFDPTLA
jgi:hypothetical protein